MTNAVQNPHPVLVYYRFIYNFWIWFTINCLYDISRSRCPLSFTLYLGCLLTNPNLTRFMHNWVLAHSVSSSNIPCLRFWMPSAIQWRHNLVWHWVVFHQSMALSGVTLCHFPSKNSSEIWHLQRYYACSDARSRASGFLMEQDKYSSVMFTEFTIVHTGVQNVCLEHNWHCEHHA
jgi:hypothetical protein